MTDETKRALVDMCAKHGDVLIVDVLNYLHRYIWVHRDMTVIIGDEEKMTGHIYGFTKLMTYLRDKFPNCAIVLALDGLDKDRRAVNVAYKAQRDHTYKVDAEMAELLKMCSLVDGVYSCYHEDYEADDVINVVSRTVQSLCINYKIQKNVYILSTDKDMYQLVDDNEICPISIIKKFNFEDGNEEIKEAQVREKFNGVGPRDLVKFRAITGDSSDNLKGYYRFRKANAAIIAENFDYNEEYGTLTLKEGSKMAYSWKKFLPTILDDMQTFRDNYSIMKLKDFDFEVDLLGKDMDVADIDDVVDILHKYKLHQYINSVCLGNYSRYREQLRKSRLRYVS